MGHNPTRLSQMAKIVQGQHLPAAFVDLQAFDENIKQILRAFDKKETLKLRVATKSLRVPELIRRVLESSNRFQGLMTYSAEETLFLAEQGFDDFLLAYPAVQNQDLACLRKLVDMGAKVSVVVDCEEHLSLLSQSLNPDTRKMGVILEADMSDRLLGGLFVMGVRRSPLRSPAQVGALAAKTQEYGNLKFKGVMAYEAQIAGFPDKNPFQKLLSKVARFIRPGAVARVAKKRRAIAAEFRNRNIKYEIFNGGGTGSLSYASEEAVLTELTAGSGFLCGHLFDYYTNLALSPAAYFGLSITRRSQDHWHTCQSGGFVASGAPGWDRMPRIEFPPGAALSPLEACGEVQTPVRTRQSQKELGSCVLFRHAKAGELAEHFNEYLLIDENFQIVRTKTYRGFGRCFY